MLDAPDAALTGEARAALAACARTAHVADGRGAAPLRAAGWARALAELAKTGRASTLPASVVAAGTDHGRGASPTWCDHRYWWPRTADRRPGRKGPVALTRQRWGSPHRGRRARRRPGAAHRHRRGRPEPADTGRRAKFGFRLSLPTGTTVPGRVGRASGGVSLATARVVGGGRGVGGKLEGSARWRNWYLLGGSWACPGWSPAGLAPAQAARARARITPSCTSPVDQRRHPAHGTAWRQEHVVVNTDPGSWLRQYASSGIWGSLLLWSRPCASGRTPFGNVRGMTVVLW